MVILTRYESITALGDNFLKLIAQGFIPTHILDWKVYYEAYLTEAEALKKQYGRTKKTRAAGNVADTYKISERCMFSIIAFMEGR
ncbi:hypothetical protein ACLI1A_13380 [Flavobacterium sp. RHBU_3]|uniref:hypothetical protein n=1 Tax=Flavobacterium sp. RHBU_3 TaxID=3391184 RepID=UPI0039855CAC